MSGNAIQIAPHLPPVDLFGSFSNAKHRVFMSATVTNDAFLVKGLRLAPETIGTPLSIGDEKWSGEKMILIPSLIDPQLDRMAIVNQFAKVSSKRKYGVVALTPSFRIAEFWKSCGAVVASTDTLYEAIEKLRRGECDSALVAASRYDGIDLPDNACRILILDSVPYATTLIDAYVESCRALGQSTNMRIARSVEQGLGRGVRGDRDYCVILLVGPDLVRQVRSRDTKREFSNQTRRQIEIGLDIGEMVAGEQRDERPAMTSFLEVISQCLDRDPAWKQYYGEQMKDIKHTEPEREILDIFKMELDAEVAFQAGQAKKAVAQIQNLIDTKITDTQEKGWYLQEIARYTYAVSKVESEKLQNEAHSKNRFVMRPASGVKVDRLEVLSQGRCSRIAHWMKRHGDHEDFKVAVDEILDRLQFGVEASRFEAALCDLGKMLGFGSERPEKEWKAGPDNLWNVADQEYFVIECKNEVSLSRAEITKDECGQMNTSCAWFKANYPDASAINLMIIPCKALSKNVCEKSYQPLLSR